MGVFSAKGNFFDAQETAAYQGSNLMFSMADREDITQASFEGIESELNGAPYTVEFPITHTF